MRRPFHVFRSNNNMMRGNKTKYPPLSVDPRSSARFNDNEKKSVTNTSAPPCKMTTTTTKCDKKKRKIGVYRLLCRLQILSFFREEIAPLKPFVGCVGIGESIFPTTHLCVSADEAKQKINARKVLEHNHLTGFCYFRKAFV